MRAAKAIDHFFDEIKRVVDEFLHGVSGIL
jgi:hypothetical protein